MRVLASVIVVLGLTFTLCFTSAPFGLLQFWARLSGLEAKGLSGRLVDHIHVDYFAEDSVKRFLEIKGMDIRYRLWPNPKILSFHAESVSLSRSNSKPLKYSEVLNYIDKSLVKKMMVRFSIDVAEISSVKLSLFSAAPAIEIDGFSLVGLQISPERLDLKSLDLSSSILRVEKIAEILRVRVEIPKEYFSDRTSAAPIEIQCDLNRQPPCGRL